MAICFPPSVHRGAGDPPDPVPSIAIHSSNREGRGLAVGQKLVNDKANLRQVADARSMCGGETFAETDIYGDGQLLGLRVPQRTVVGYRAA